MTNIRKVFFLLLAFALLGAAAASAVSFGEESIRENVVQVSNVDELLAAIAPGTEIVLAPGEYNLTKAKNYARGGGMWYHWESCFDGAELVITDLTGLTIRGEDLASVTICTEPRYANVIRFEQTRDVRIAELTCGHTVEQGACSGGVLNFQDCRQIEVQSCRLYGCGTWGITARDCWNLHVDCSDIYECSEGCADIYGSYNVLMENSRFYNCKLWNGAFIVANSREVAVINSEVCGNYCDEYFTSTSLVSAYNTVGLYFGGLDVHDNQFSVMFDVTNYPVTVEKSKFAKDCRFWYEEMAPVSPEGKALTVADLSSMSRRNVQWSPAELAQLPTVEAGEDGKIHVTTVDEFLSAIAPGAHIYLEPGVYNLSEATNYGSFGGDYYRWEECYDGPELVISASNLTIEGASKDTVTISATPRYANVLRFENVGGLHLQEFTAGHTQEPGSCSGGVIQLNSASDVNIERCKLYGCGILGIWAMDSSNIDVAATEIYECSSGAAWFYGCYNVSINHCNCHDNGGNEFYADYSCTDVYVDGEPVSDNQVWY